MNHKIRTRKKLLKPDGSLSEPGWANHLIFDYSPFDIKTSKLRLKEWDYYIIVDDDFAFSTVVADNRYMGLANASFFDFKENQKYQFVTPLVFPMGKLNMPTDSSKGDIFFKNRSCTLTFSIEPDGRRLMGKYESVLGRKELEFDIFLRQFKDDDTMVIATPWANDKKAFYYNQKINCMPASGYIRIGDRRIELSPKKHFGTLDWGRGVWTYENIWRWGSGNGYINGKRFGFNIGYGFGDTTAASENMIFYDGKCHKFDRIRFEIPKSIMQPWKFITSDGRFNMNFFPVFDNKTDLSMGPVSQHSHQVFGKLFGKAILDDGTELNIDNLTVFAERVHNKY